MSIADIKAMDSAERLRTMEQLWEVMCQDATEPESPAWHGDVLAERRRKIESGEAEFISMDELKKRLLG